METEINKTIVVSYDDITRMKDFCTNKGEGVTKDFYDWYVNDNAFFSKTGMLICEKVINGSEKKFVVSFDFNNPDIPSFVMYDYAKQKPVCRYIMIREDNLAMKDITLKISWIDMKFFMDPSSIFLSNETYDEVKKDCESKLYLDSKVKEKEKKLGKQEYAFGGSGRNRNLKNAKKQLNIVEKQLEKVNYKIATFMAQQGVYFVYATMYYFAKNKAKEVTGMTKEGSIEFITGRQVKALYKYTGYVNVDEVKVYKPVIKKDGPVREYGRHIEKWSVRGHYRKVGDKTIWIEPHERGEGELEKRIYGTEKESEVNVIPKVFEVVRNVKEHPSNLDEKIIDKLKVKSTFRKPEEQAKLNPSKPGFWTKIFSFFKLKFK